ncbi:MAG: ATP-binding protein [Minwuia sp.]|nr:ATP-binding protein [Minwuia sp.]
MDVAETVLTIPDFCLVLLVGASGAGKSTFAARHFRPTEIVSSDACRALVSDDEADQSASVAAFELVHLITRKRLAARRLTVIDATNLRVGDRKPLLAFARRFHAPVVTFAFLLDAATCVARNRERGAQGGRDVGAEVVAMQQTELRKGMPDLRMIGNLTAFESGTAVDRITEIRRVPS